MINTLIAIAIALTAIFGGAGATVYASQGSLPNDLLYPVMTLAEDVQLALTPDLEQRVALTLDFADRRVQEIVSLQALGEAIPSRVAVRLEQEVQQTLQLAARMGEAEMIRTLEQIQLRTQTQLIIMEILRNQDPTNPGLIEAQIRLEQHVQLAASGQEAPAEFQLQVQEQLQLQTGQDGSEAGAGPGEPSGNGEMNQAGDGEPQGDASGPAETGYENGSGQPADQSSGPKFFEWLWGASGSSGGRH